VTASADPVVWFACGAVDDENPDMGPCALDAAHAGDHQDASGARWRRFVTQRCCRCGGDTYLTVVVGSVERASGPPADRVACLLCAAEVLLPPGDGTH
jgi:hypothetical protein